MRVAGTSGLVSGEVGRVRMWQRLANNLLEIVEGKSVGICSGDASNHPHSGIS